MSSPIKYSILYIPSVGKNRYVDCFTCFAHKLSKNFNVIVDDMNKSRSIENIFSLKNLSLLAKSYKKININKFSYYYWVRLPLLKSVFEKCNINDKLNILLLKIILRKTKNKLVLIFPPFPQAINYINILKPDILICDYVDSRINDIDIKKTNSNFVLVNSSYYLKKFSNININVKNISAGYYSKNLIERIHKKNYYKPYKKTVLLIASINWRLDFSLINYLINNLKEYNFLILHTDLYKYDLKIKDEKQNIKGKFAQKQWNRIKNMPNVKIISIDNMNKIPDINFSASVGIIPLNTKYIFNKYSNPVKTYLYLAMGIPVVSTNIEPLKYQKNKYIFCTNSYKDFAKQIIAYSKLNIPKQEKGNMYQLAAKNTIENKVNQVSNIIKHNTLLTK